ncbi:MAG TPA: hypothetical protein VGL05_20080 [Kribbella sp.]
MTALAADMSDSPLAGVMAYVVIGGLLVAGLTMVIIRVVRSRKPREQQLARLAAQLDGRSRVYVRMIECGLDHRDLHSVAASRGYRMFVNEAGKYYEFIHAHQAGRTP